MKPVCLSVYSERDLAQSQIPGSGSKNPGFIGRVCFIILGRWVELGLSMGISKTDIDDFFELLAFRTIRYATE